MSGVAAGVSPGLVARVSRSRGGGCSDGSAPLAGMTEGVDVTASNAGAATGCTRAHCTPARTAPARTSGTATSTLARPHPTSGRRLTAGCRAALGRQDARAGSRRGAPIDAGTTSGSGAAMANSTADSSSAPGRKPGSVARARSSRLLTSSATPGQAVDRAARVEGVPPSTARTTAARAYTSAAGVAGSPRSTSGAAKRRAPGPGVDSLPAGCTLSRPVSNGRPALVISMQAGWTAPCTRALRCRAARACATGPQAVTVIPTDSGPCVSTSARVPAARPHTRTGPAGVSTRSGRRARCGWDSPPIKCTCARTASAATLSPGSGRCSVTARPVATSRADCDSPNGPCTTGPAVRYPGSTMLPVVPRALVALRALAAMAGIVTARTPSLGASSTASAGLAV